MDREVSPMNRTLVGFSMVLLLAAAALPCRGVAPAEDEAAAVERLERDLVAAIARTDLLRYGQIVADDYVVFDASGKELTKREIVESYRSGTRRYSGLEIYDVHARVFGDTAVVTARTRGFRHEEDRDVPNRVRYIRVYSRRAGRWQAVTQMSAPLADEAGTAPVPSKQPH
jgi:ketosteroid isomerase-like protein